MVTGLYKNKSRKQTEKSTGLNSTDDRGWTLLHVASKKGDLEMVTHLLKAGVDPNINTGGPKSTGLTPLHLAASEGHVEVMDALLEYGANIEAKTRGLCGWTPLHHAAKEKRREAVRFLIQNGAFLSPDMNDLRFNPPLHYCVDLEYAYTFYLQSMAPENQNASACS